MSKKIHIIVGGTYFLEDRVKFFDNPEFKKHKDSLVIERVDWSRVVKCKSIPVKGDIVFVFGIKHWVRRLHKKKYGSNKIASCIIKFLHKNFYKKAQIGILEDLDLRGSRSVGSKIINRAIKDLDCKLVLLREYLKDVKYSSRVKPFGICSVSRDGFIKDLKKKKTDFYFRGDSSSKDRSKIVGGISKNSKINSSLLVYKGGEKSKGKISESKFFEELSRSHVCLNVKGNGYSCYRYQEIPSVGSIIATPNYPLVTINDYKDMVSCIKFDSVKDLNNKINTVLSSKNLVDDIRQTSIELFKKYHTTEKRFLEFMNHLDSIG
jgi:hypothetical protein